MIDKNCAYYFIARLIYCQQQNKFVTFVRYFFDEFRLIIEITREEVK